MNLKISRCPDKKFKPYVERAANFYAEFLIPNKRLRDNINLEIRFNPKIDEYGYASIEDYNEYNKPRYFLVEIHPWIGAPNILKTLAHEMVHVKQYVRGETNETLSKWRGVPIDSDKLDYFLHPWEMDAYSLETALVYKFSIKEKLWEVFEGFVNPSDEIKKTEIKWKKNEKKLQKSDKLVA